MPNQILPTKIFSRIFYLTVWKDHRDFETEKVESKKKHCFFYLNVNNMHILYEYSSIILSSQSKL